MPRMFLLSLGFLVGAALTVQSGINAQLRSYMGSPFRAAFASAVVTTLLLGAITLLNRSEPMALQQSPWWMWLGGLLGAAILTGALVLAPRLGAATLVATIVAGQLVVAVVVDHYGLIGYPVVPVSWPRLLGAVLLFVGALLIQRH